MNPQDYIAKYGGKLGGWFFLKDFRGFERHLLPLHFVPAEIGTDSLEEILPRELSRSWILRGSHPNDHEGLVDILDSPTVKGFNLSRGGVIEEFKRNISDIRANANKLEIFAYNVYEGQEYDGKIRVGIQPFNDGVRGSIVEHPHEKGTYLIDLVTALSGRNNAVLDRIVVVDGKIDESNSLLRFRTDKRRAYEIARKVIGLYKKVKETCFIDPTYSFQMEFGVNTEFDDKDDILFYQARPFLKFAEPTFEIQDVRKAYDCFGITDEGGVTLPIVKTIPGEAIKFLPEEFAWIAYNMGRKMNPVVNSKNIGVFIPMGHSSFSLEHNSYRWIRKAKVSLLDCYDASHFGAQDKIKVVCNGLTYKMDNAT